MTGLLTCTTFFENCLKIRTKGTSIDFYVWDVNKIQTITYNSMWGLFKSIIYLFIYFACVLKSGALNPSTAGQHALFSGLLKNCPHIRLVLWATFMKLDKRQC